MDDGHVELMCFENVGLGVVNEPDGYTRTMISKPLLYLEGFLCANTNESDYLSSFNHNGSTCHPS